MKLMKKVNALVLGLAVLLAIRCGKQNKQDDPDPINSQRQQCIITSIVETRFNSPNTTAFYYNPQRVLMGYNNGDRYSSTKDSVSLLYDSAGELDKVIEYENGIVKGYITYDFNSAGLLNKASTFHGTFGSGTAALVMYNTFEYNSANKLIKINSFNGQHQAFVYSKYIYPSATSVRNEIYQIANNDTLPLGQIREYTFDNNKSFQNLLGPAYRVGQISENNPLTLKITYPGIDTANYSYSYTFNSYGFPISETAYFNGNQSSNTIYNYDCQ
jgi:hypothetical protein